MAKCGIFSCFFNSYGKAVALSTKNDVFYSSNTGRTWEHVRSYSKNSNDTIIQSIALNPSGNTIFLGAKYLRNYLYNPNYFIIKKTGDSSWGDHREYTPQYRVDGSNRKPLPTDYNYQYSVWLPSDKLINLFLSPERTSGALTFLDQVESDGEVPTMDVLKSVNSDRPFVATAMAAINDRIYAVAGYEIYPVVPRIRTKHLFIMIGSHLSPLNKSDVDQRYLPDYMTNSSNLADDNRFSFLSIEKDQKKIYRSVARAAVALRQQEIIVSKSSPVSGKYLCIGMDPQGYIWLGTEFGMYKSAISLFNLDSFPYNFSIP